MAKNIEVTATRPHRTGWAAKGKVDKGDKYTVPEDRVASLVRQKLIEKPKGWEPAKKAEPTPPAETK